VSWFFQSPENRRFCGSERAEACLTHGIFFVVKKIKKFTFAAVALMNLNLAANSVAFCQLSKLACIPVTLLSEKVCYGKIPSLTILLTLLPLLVGVGIETFFSMLGRY
jgi:hypothetical protein